jgi:hypothetical protein
MVRNKANKPKAAGRLTVISGMRLPWTVLEARWLSSGLPSSAPQTKQRSASTPTRVPQVGQSLVEVVSFSGFIFSYFSSWRIDQHRSTNFADQYQRVPIFPEWHSSGHYTSLRTGVKGKNFKVWLGIL